MNPSFEHIHLSGYHGAKKAEFDSMLSFLTPKSDIFTMTECYKLWMHKKIRNLPGWDSHTVKAALFKGRYQCVIAWRSNRFTLSGKPRWVKASKTVFYNSKGKPMVRVYIPVVTLRDSLTGEVFDVSVQHMPSHIEGFGSNKKAVSGPKRRVKAWNEAAKTVSTLKTKGRPMLNCGDWNLNFRIRWCRVEVKKIAKGRLSWKPPWKSLHGTHGRRVIDASRTYGKRMTTKNEIVLKKQKGFDHAPYKETVTIKSNRKDGSSMAYKRLPNNLPQILRKYGLKVVEVDGWRQRGRPSTVGSFNPVGVLCHHTATPKSASDKNVINLLVKGRSDLPGPLCHLGLGRDGTAYIIASGRANHAGKAKASGTVVAGDGNSLYIGIEAFNDGVGEKWPKVQYDAYVLLAAVLSKEITHNSVQTVRGHKETSVTGKIDPTFSMKTFRENVSVKLRNLQRTLNPKQRPKKVRQAITRTKNSLKSVRDQQKKAGPIQRHRLDKAESFLVKARNWLQKIKKK